MLQQHITIFFFFCSIKIHSITNLQETEKIITVPDHSGVQMIDWSSDGQLLAVTSMAGTVYIYVTKLTVLYAVSPPRIAILSSLSEVSIYVYSPEKVYIARLIFYFFEKVLF